MLSTASAKTSGYRSAPGFVESSNVSQSIKAFSDGSRVVAGVVVVGVAAAVVEEKEEEGDTTKVGKVNRLLRYIWLFGVRL